MDSKKQNQKSKEVVMCELRNDFQDSVRKEKKDLEFHIALNSYIRKRRGNS